MPAWPDLSAALGGILWAAAGAAAVQRCVPLEDASGFDALVAAADWEDVRRRLVAAGYRLGGEAGAGASRWVAPGGSRVAIHVGTDAWVQQALVEAKSNRDAQGLPVLPLPYVVLMELPRGRAMGLARLVRALGRASDETLEGVRYAVRRYEPGAVRRLEGMIQAGQEERRSGRWVDDRILVRRAWRTDHPRLREQSRRDLGPW